MAKLSVRDLNVSGKRVLVRVDFNVPLKDGRVADDTRLRASVPTIKLLCDRGARVILVSHLGRPDGKPDPKYSLKPVAPAFAELLGRPVRFAGEDPGELMDGDVALLENVRFHPEEEANDLAFARKLASLADFYVNDAFGTAHRAHASTEGAARHFKQAAAGLLMEKELEYLGERLKAPAKPFITAKTDAAAAPCSKTIAAARLQEGESARRVPLKAARRPASRWCRRSRTSWRARRGSASCARCSARSRDRTPDRGCAG